MIVDCLVNLKRRTVSKRGQVITGIAVVIAFSLASFATDWLRDLDPVAVRAVAVAVVCELQSWQS
jgi:hypothetical protein